ncbi:MAG TPA: PHB depolymerase family esterase, partial [Pseudoxanthomonas sp.]|nr:PHB depolymerase family esterase [Pseudoxanthomonas sp.]
WAMLGKKSRNARLRTVAMLICITLSGGLSAANSPSHNIILNDLSPFASAQEVTQRLLTPVTQDRISKFREKIDFSFQDQVVVPGEEPFELYVPEPDARGKFGLMVFVWPADDIQVPADWWKVLRDRNMIYVASRRSGNTENIFDRRVPLALHGYEHVRLKYDIDPERVYIGGFSGGSRTAQRVAMAYPDVFRGVFMTGGSDTLGGESGFTLPSADLVGLLQERTRFVFSTGGNDSVNRAKDARTRKNLEALCMQGIRIAPQNGVEHWVPDGRGLARVMNELERPVLRSQEADSCNAMLRQSVDDALASVVGMIEVDDLAGASVALGQADGSYGGLASPRSVQLAEIIAEKAGLYQLP